MKTQRSSDFPSHDRRSERTRTGMVVGLCLALSGVLPHGSFPQPSTRTRQCKKGPPFAFQGFFLQVPSSMSVAGTWARGGTFSMAVKCGSSASVSVLRRRDRAGLQQDLSASGLTGDSA